MTDTSFTIVEDRAFTQDEREMLQWLLASGDERAQSFVPHIENARVFGRCGCGCASIDFVASSTKPNLPAGMEQLGDEYFWVGTMGGTCAVFAYARGNSPAGLETYSLDGIETPSQLPSITQLRKEPWGFAGRD
jgi:hypothetical protein